MSSLHNDGRVSAQSSISQ